MENESKNQENTTPGDKGCGCDDNCCSPKKKSIWPKIIFTVVILAVIGIVVAKLFFTTPKAPVTNSQVVNDPNSPKWADSCKSGATCDTTKGSSCCGK
jgi:hypothetical protein